MDELETLVATEEKYYYHDLAFLTLSRYMFFTMGVLISAEWLFLKIHFYRQLSIFFFIIFALGLFVEKLHENHKKKPLEDIVKHH